MASQSTEDFSGSLTMKKHTAASGRLGFDNSSVVRQSDNEDLLSG